MGMSDVDLVDLALDDPDAAERGARAVLGSSPSPERRVRALQALGIVHRDRGSPDLALGDLRGAVLTATAIGDAALISDVRATYGLTLVEAGQRRRGLHELDRATFDVEHPTARTRLRRSMALLWVGRRAESHDEMLRAARAFAEQGDRLWHARTLHHLGLVELALGDLDAAAEHTRHAIALFTPDDDPLEPLWAEQNLGEIAVANGDLARALAIFDGVAAEYLRLGRPRPHLAVTRCRALRAAGLPREALEVAREALAGTTVHPMDRAALELVAASALVQVEERPEAAVLARAARDGYRRLGNTWAEAQARLVLVRARRGERGVRWDREAREVAALLHAERIDDAPLALALAAERSASSERSALLAAAATYRSGRPALVRASGWWATALARDDDGDSGGVLRACARGLDALDEHRTTLGSTELRALATGHGSELAALALRHAAAGAGGPRALLRWSERWRATALAQPPVTPGDEPVLPSLAALRDNGRRLAEARAGGEPTDQLDQERRRLERAVRAEHHRQSGAVAVAEHLDVDHLVTEVGDGCLVELVDVDGVVHVIVVHRGRVRRAVAGTTADALALTGSAAFVLRRAARGRPFAPGDLGQRLQDTILGPAARLLPEGPVTVAPTSRLHGVPWALLPALAGRPFAVVPSAAQWLRARAVPVPAARPGDVVLLAGPGLGTGGAEVPVLAQRRPDAVLLDGADATVAASMTALDGARLAHVAAHGRFRADSPLFSALELADGPLTVHDLERLRVAPHRVVLSACESGVLAPVGAEELLGLASALFALGTAGLVCSVAEVDDAATAALMVDLHAHLDAGLDPGAALHAVRAAAPGDPTATAFVALGV